MFRKAICAVIFTLAMLLVAANYLQDAGAQSLAPTDPTNQVGLLAVKTTANNIQTQVYIPSWSIPSPQFIPQSGEYTACYDLQLNRYTVQFFNQQCVAAQTVTFEKVNIGTVYYVMTFSYSPVTNLPNGAVLPLGFDAESGEMTIDFARIAPTPGPTK